MRIQSILENWADIVAAEEAERHRRVLLKEGRCKLCKCPSSGQWALLYHREGRLSGLARITGGEAVFCLEEEIIWTAWCTDAASEKGLLDYLKKNPSPEMVIVGPCDDGSRHFGTLIHPKTTLRPIAFLQRTDLLHADAIRTLTQLRASS